MKMQLVNLNLTSAVYKFSFNLYFNLYNYFPYVNYGILMHSPCPLPNKTIGFLHSCIEQVLQDFFQYIFFSFSKSSNMMGDIKGFAWNCGRLRRGNASTFPKTLFFEKTLKIDFDFFFFIETHHEDENDLPNELVDMLHTVTTNSNGLVQRYYGIKQRLLGLEDMTLADIYAPMKDDLPSVDWADARRIVLDSFQTFDSDFHSFASDMFDRDRLHVFPSKVKRGGAFCSSSHPTVRPFVMLNHLNLHTQQ